MRNHAGNEPILPLLNAQLLIKVSGLALTRKCVEKMISVEDPSAQTIRSGRRLLKFSALLIILLFGASYQLARGEPPKLADGQVQMSPISHADALDFYKEMIGYVFVKCDRATWVALADNRAGDFQALATASEKMNNACSQTLSKLQQDPPPEGKADAGILRFNMALAACRIGYSARTLFAEKLADRAKSPENAAIKDELQKQFEIWDIQGQLCMRGLERATAAVGVNTGELVKAWVDVYVDCVKERMRSLSDGDRAVKDYYPLLSLTDEEVRSKLHNLCPGSGPGGATGPAGPGIVDHPNIAGAVDRFIASRRVDLTKARDAINAPGPQPAILLRPLQIETDDYPQEALKREEQGSSKLTYTIGIEGKITRCKAVGASKLLDTASCEYATGRMAFFPARNENGKPIEETRTQTVNWVLPN